MVPSTVVDELHEVDPGPPASQLADETSKETKQAIEKAKAMVKIFLDIFFMNLVLPTFNKSRHTSSQ